MTNTQDESFLRERLKGPHFMDEMLKADFQTLLKDILFYPWAIWVHKNTNIKYKMQTPWLQIWLWTIFLNGNFTMASLPIKDLSTAQVLLAKVKETPQNDL